MRARGWLIAWEKEPWLGVIWGTSEDPSSLYIASSWRPLWALLVLSAIVQKGKNKA